MTDKGTPTPKDLIESGLALGEPIGRIPEVHRPSSMGRYNIEPGSGHNQTPSLGTPNDYELVFVPGTDRYALVEEASFDKAIDTLSENADNKARLDAIRERIAALPVTGANHIAPRESTK